MHFALLLLAAVAAQAPDSQQQVADALTLLNNYIDAVTFLDACAERNDVRALRPLEERMDAARARAVAAYPALSGAERAGDTDFQCRHSAHMARTPRRVIRKDVERLLGRLDAALPDAGKGVR